MYCMIIGKISVFITKQTTPSLSEIQGPSQEVSFHKNFRSAVRNFVLVETKLL